jgi:hypothetical protein
MSEWLKVRHDGWNRGVGGSKRGGLSKGWKKGLNMRGRVGITCQI